MNKRGEIWDHAPICRLCLQQDGFLLTIFNNHVNTANGSIVKKIMDCTALEPSSGDGLPPCICHRCLYKVELCSEFKQQCILSDATLRRIRRNGTGELEEVNSEPDQDESNKPPTVSSVQFEQFTRDNQRVLLEQNQSFEDVVMVVNPEMEYESDNESELEQPSDADGAETTELTELAELRNVFMCKFCDRAYTEREACASHEKAEHSSNAPFACVPCDMAFADRTNYTAHQKSVHQNDKPFECPQCPRSFSRRSDLRKHTVVHTGIKPFTCNICCKSFSRNTNLTKHLRIHSGHKPYVCPQCPKTFISKGDLTRHALIHSGHKPFACSYCDQSFGRRDKLARHEKRHCNGTGTGTNSNSSNVNPPSNLEYHPLSYFQTSIKNEPEHEEDGEDENWMGENMVINVDPFNHDEEHIDKDEVMSESSPEMPRVPDHVTADDIIDSSPKRALIAANAVKKFPCLICHKRFSTADKLRFHSVVHGPRKQHTCVHCPKSFLRKRELDRHIATHTGLKPYKCPSCDKRFGRKDKLGRHMRIHQGSYVCIPCGTTFSHIDALTVHMNTHNDRT